MGFQIMFDNAFCRYLIRFVEDHEAGFVISVDLLEYLLHGLYLVIDLGVTQVGDVNQ